MSPGRIRDYAQESLLLPPTDFGLLQGHRKPHLPTLNTSSVTKSLIGLSLGTQARCPGYLVVYSTQIHTG